MSVSVRNVVCALFCSVFFLLALQVAAVDEYGDQSAPKVLLAYERTAFKKALVASLVDALKSDTYVRTVDHNRGELASERASDYKAVIIINSGVNSRVRPKVHAWLNQVEETANIILLTTYREQGWSPRYPSGVDGITSPSTKSDVGSLTSTIVGKVSALIN